MKIVFSTTGYFSVVEGNVWVILNLLGGRCNFGIGVDDYSFGFSPGSYDYSRWLYAVCGMVADAKEVRITKVREELLCILVGENEARLYSNGECSVDDEVFHERKA